VLFVGVDWAEDHHDVCSGVGTGVFWEVSARIRFDSSATNRQREYPGPAPCASHDPSEQIATSGCGRSGGATTTGGRGEHAGRKHGDSGCSRMLMTPWIFNKNVATPLARSSGALSPSRSAPETNVSIGGNRPVSPRHHRGHHPANDRPTDQKIHQSNVPEVLTLQFPGQIGRRPIQRDQRHKNQPQKHGPILNSPGRHPGALSGKRWTTPRAHFLVRKFGASCSKPTDQKRVMTPAGQVRAPATQRRQRTHRLKFGSTRPAVPLGTRVHSGTPLTGGEFLALLSG
jgi:hypothetical protein